MSFPSQNTPKSSRLGLRPRPHWRSLQRSPRPLAGFKGPLRGRRGMEGREGRTRGGEEGKGGKRGNGEGRGKGEVGGIAPWLLRGIDTSAPNCGRCFSDNDDVFFRQELTRVLSSCWWRYSAPTSSTCSSVRGRPAGWTCCWRSSLAREPRRRSRANHSTCLFHSRSPTITRNTKSVQFSSVLSSSL